VILPYLAVNLAGNDVFRPFLQAPGLPGITLDADP
jgi:hypothetical protein